MTLRSPRKSQIYSRSRKFKRKKKIQYPFLFLFLLLNLTIYSNIFQLSISKRNFILPKRLSRRNDRKKKKNSQPPSIKRRERISNNDPPPLPPSPPLLSSRNQTSLHQERERERVQMPTVANYIRIDFFPLLGLT